MRYRIAPHLAFMVQWLRVLGVDVRLWEKGEILDPLRDSLIQWKPYPLVRKGLDLQVITLSSPDLPRLVREFLEKTDRKPEGRDLFSRCLRCNTRLIPITPDEAKTFRPDLPEYVYRTQKKFNRCPVCRQLFWGGTHVRNMLRTLREWGIPVSDDMEGKEIFSFDEPPWKS